MISPWPTPIDEKSRGQTIEELGFGHARASVLRGPDQPERLQQRSGGDHPAAESGHQAGHRQRGQQEADGHRDEGEAGAHAG